MKSNNIKISVVILNWNGGAENCIESVTSALKQNYDNKEIIFVDNASTDGSNVSLKKIFPDIIFIQLEHNCGCPQGRNEGVKYATGDIVCFLDNDGMWESTSVLSSAATIFERHSDLGAMYSRVTGYDNGVQDPPLDPIPVPTARKKIYFSSSFRGGASFVRRDLFESLGGFPGDFFRQGEERYLSLKIYHSRYKVAYWPNEFMRHKGSGYTGKKVVVSRLNIENNMKTLIRLYPLLPAIFIGVPKWMAGCLALIRNTTLLDLWEFNYSVFKELRARKRSVCINLQSYCLVETLRQGYTDNEYSDRPIVVSSISRILLGRYRKWFGRFLKWG